jgi:hypothetical protein
VTITRFFSVADELDILRSVLFSGILFLAFKAALPISRGFVLAVGVFLSLVAYTIAGPSLTLALQNLGYILLGSVLSLMLQRSAQHRVGGE